MAAYFFDSSGLVKRYVSETGTSWVRSLTHQNAGHQIFVARITAVEVTAAIARRRRGGSLTPAQATSLLSRFRKHLAGRYTVLELNPALLTDAMKQANGHDLRAYDAVQLAAALALNGISLGGFTFVSSDQDLNAAARAEGLSVDDPLLHP